MKYTPEQIRPKKYPDEKPSESGFGVQYRVLLDDGRQALFNWNPVTQCETMMTWDRYVEWFIDVPNPPEELKFLAYPENKPEKFGLYMVHWIKDKTGNDIAEAYFQMAVDMKLISQEAADEAMRVYGEAVDYVDEWTTMEWWYSTIWSCDIDSDSRNIDYFIPVRLDREENEMMKCKIIDDKHADIITVRNTEENYPVDIDRTDFQKEVIRWLDLQGYDVVKREPELKPCPYCGGNCYTWNPAENKWSVACYDCPYNSGSAYSESEAIRHHNLIADNVLTRKEE